MNFYLKDENKGIKEGILAIIIAVILLLIFESFLIFWLGYLGGIFAKLLIGNWLIEGFKLINITLNKDNIPLLAGTLSWIGSFFHSIYSVNNNK